MKNLNILVLLTLFWTVAKAEIVVIGNPDSGLESINIEQLRDLYLGRSRSFPNGIFVLPIDLLNLRDDFYKKLTDRPIVQINAYWARLLFTGQLSPPTKVEDAKSVIKIVSQNKGAIAYINSNDIDKKKVRVIYSFR